MLSAFSVKLWQFYGATALQFLKYTQWGRSQSLLSKCVSKDDMGKMYGVCGIISALIPFASNGILRSLMSLPNNFNHKIYLDRVITWARLQRAEGKSDAVNLDRLLNICRALGNLS